MRSEGKFIGGLLLGLGLAYLLDPDRGARRRAIARDKATHYGRQLAENLDATTRDLRNRARGTAAELRSRLRHEEVEDEIVHDRVRSAIGRAASNPGAIEVSVMSGTVTLRGRVPEQEVEELLRAAGRVRGVAGVVNELEVPGKPDDVPSLQGGQAG